MIVERGPDQPAPVGVPPSKVCRGCAKFKALSEFNRHKGRRDGRQSRCQTCQQSYEVVRRAALRAFEREAPERKRCPKCGETKAAAEFRRDLNQKDTLTSRCSECLRAVAREWVAANPERHRQDSLRQYYYKGRDRARERYQSDAEYKRRRDRHRTVRRRAGGTLTAAEWAAMLDFYGTVCLRCGSGPPTLDHVVPICKGGENTIANAQPLCRSCNSRKGKGDTDYRDPSLHADFMAALEATGGLLFALASG